MVILEGHIKRFVGLSTDARPRPGVQLDESDLQLPVGSSLLLLNRIDRTSAIERWDGNEWLPTGEGVVTVDGQQIVLLELAAIRELLEQLVEQVVPVIVDRKARVVPMAVHVRDPVFRRQGVEQLAISGRGKAIGVGEEDALRHGRHCRTD